MGSCRTFTTTAATLALALALSACDGTATPAVDGDPAATATAPASPEPTASATAAPTDAPSPAPTVVEAVLLGAGPGTFSSKEFTTEEPLRGFVSDNVGDGTIALWVAEADREAGPDGGPPTSCPAVDGVVPAEPDPEASPTEDGGCLLVTTDEPTPSAGRGEGFGIEVPPGTWRLWATASEGIDRVSYRLLTCEQALQEIEFDELSGTPTC